MVIRIKRFNFFLSGLAYCLPMFGIAQVYGGSEPFRAKLDNRSAPHSGVHDSIPQHFHEGTFDTSPMPNAYRDEKAVAMPNAYRGDDCVVIPNAYQEDEPASFIIKRTGKSTPDSLVIDELGKIRDTLKNQAQEKQRLKAERP